MTMIGPPPEHGKSKPRTPAGCQHPPFRLWVSSGTIAERSGHRKVIRIGTLASLQDAGTMGSFDPVVSLVPRSTSGYFGAFLVDLREQQAQDS